MNKHNVLKEKIKESCAGLKNDIYGLVKSLETQNENLQNEAGIREKELNKLMEEKKFLEAELLKLRQETEADKLVQQRLTVIIDSFKAEDDKLSLQQVRKHLFLGKRMRTIDFLTDDSEDCPRCNLEMDFDLVDLAYFKRGSKNIEGFIKYEVLYCGKCTHHYITESMRENILNSIYPNTIKENSYRNNVDQGIQIDLNIKRKINQGTNKNQYENPEKYYENLSLNSELKILGYQITGLSKEDRWLILLTKAVPKLGLEKTIKIIEGNIQMRENQQDGSVKFARAISAWRFDIKRLIEYFNQSR